MRSVLKNKKGVQFGMNEFLVLLIGLIIILIVLYFMFGKEWGAMLRNFLPSMETTADNNYNEISGTDEAVYDLPSDLPSFDINKKITSDCPYYVVKYKEGIFSIFNSSSTRIGAFKNRTSPVNSWNMYDLTGMIKIYQQDIIDGTGILNQINYYGVKDVNAEAFIFNGKNITCGLLIKEAVKSTP